MRDEWRTGSVVDGNGAFYWWSGGGVVVEWRESRGGVAVSSRWSGECGGTPRTISSIPVFHHNLNHYSP